MNPRDARLEITNHSVTHKVADIVKKSERSDKRDVLSIKGTKDYATHQAEMPLVAPEISV